VSVSIKKFTLRLNPKERTSLVVVCLFGIFVQTGIWYTYGIRQGADSELYTEAAMQLLEGHLPEGRLIWYSSYIFFIALVFFAGGGLTTIVAIQILVALMASLALFYAVRYTTNSYKIGLISIVLYLLWIKIHQWNIFIYTESLFTSMVIITFAVLITSFRWYHYLICLFIFLYTFFLRPTGFSLLIAVLAFILSFYGSSRVGKFAIIIFAFVISLAVLHRMLVSYELVESYAKGEIIYPDVRLGISVPSNLIVPKNSLPPLVRLIQFVVFNPLYFIKITAIKVFLFLSNVKPYFSWLHNLLIILILYPLYGFGIVGLRKYSYDKRILHFIVSYIIAQTITVGLTTENWDGRFLVPVLPFIFILSAIGLYTLRSSIKKASS